MKLLNYVYNALFFVAAITFICFVIMDNRQNKKKSKIFLYASIISVAAAITIFLGVIFFGGPYEG